MVNEQLALLRAAADPALEVIAAQNRLPLAVAALPAQTPPPVAFDAEAGRVELGRAAAAEERGLRVHELQYRRNLRRVEAGW